MLHLILPILICGLFQQLYSMTDAIVIGRSADQDALAVIGGSSSMLISIFYGLSGGIVSGAMFAIAYDCGASDESEKKSCSMTGLLLALILGAAAAAYFLGDARRLLALLQVPAQLADRSAAWMRLYALGFPPYFMFQMEIGQMRACGELKRSSLYLILSFLLNILLDIILVSLLHAQETGIAIAFILTQCIAALAAFPGLHSLIPSDLRQPRISRNDLLRILRIGIPSSAISIAYALSNTVVQSGFNQLGSATIAGYAIHNKIDGFYWIMMTCMGTALTTFLSQNYGAHQLLRVRRTIRISLLITMLITACTSAVFCLLSGPLTALYTSDLPIQAQAAAILTFMAPCYLAYPLNEIMSAALKCIGRAVPASVAAFCCVCIVRTAWIIIHFNELSIRMILLVYPLSWVLSAICLTLEYFFFRKRALYD